MRSIIAPLELAVRLVPSAGTVDMLQSASGLTESNREGVSLFGHSLQIGQAFFILFSNHFFHAEEQTHEFGDEWTWAVHGLCNQCGVALGCEHKIHGIVGLKRRDEVQLDGDPGWRNGFGNFHASSTDVLVPAPIVDCTFGFLRSAVDAIDLRINSFPGRP